MNNKQVNLTSEGYVKFGNNSGCVSADYNITPSNYDGEIFIVPYDSKLSGTSKYIKKK